MDIGYIDFKISSMSRILHLKLHRKFFDMIASGEKLEEYRNITTYWANRLVDELRAAEEPGDFTFMLKGFLWTMQTPQHYDIVQFMNGYNKKAPLMEVECLDIKDGFTKPEWSYGYAPAFIIKLGKILSIKNYKQ